jgi:hypothetical protein
MIRQNSRPCTVLMHELVEIFHGWCWPGLPGENCVSFSSLNWTLRTKTVTIGVWGLSTSAISPSPPLPDSHPSFPPSVSHSHWPHCAPWKEGGACTPLLSWGFTTGRRRCSTTRQASSTIHQVRLNHTSIPLLPRRLVRLLGDVSMGRLNCMAFHPAPLFWHCFLVPARLQMNGFRKESIWVLLFGFLYSNMEMNCPRVSCVCKHVREGNSAKL